MKRLSLVVTFALSLFIITGLAYAEAKFSYVDIGRIFDDYKKTKEYDKVLEGNQKAYEKEREEKLTEVKELQEKLGLLSEEERESRKGELENMIVGLQEFDRSSTEDLRKQRDEKVREIFNDIEKAINTYAKKEGITFVFDKRALVYQDDKLDITTQVLKILNK